MEEKLLLRNFSRVVKNFDRQGLTITSSAVGDTARCAFLKGFLGLPTELSKDCVQLWLADRNRQLSKQLQIVDDTVSKYAEEMGSNLVEKIIDKSSAEHVYTTANELRKDFKDYIFKTLEERFDQKYQKKLKAVLSEINDQMESVVKVDDLSPDQVQAVFGQLNQFRKQLVSSAQSIDLLTPKANSSLLVFSFIENKDPNTWLAFLDKVKTDHTCQSVVRNLINRNPGESQDMAQGEYGDMFQALESEYLKKKTGRKSVEDVMV